MPRARATLLEMNAQHPEPRKIQQAKARLEAGEVIGYPTDGLYALGADIEARGAIERLYALRGHDRKKPLAIVTSSLSDASRYAVIDDARYRLLKRVLPGPHTFILPATREAPKVGEVKRRQVGIRVPSHPVTHALIEALGRPLLSTSALRRQAREGDEEAEVFADAADPLAVADAFGDALGLVISAGLLPGTPSSVIDWTEPEPVVLRRGLGDVSLFES